MAYTLVDALDRELESLRWVKEPELRVGRLVFRILMQAAVDGERAESIRCRRLDRLAWRGVPIIEDGSMPVWGIGGRGLSS